MGEDVFKYAAIKHFVVYLLCKISPLKFTCCLNSQFFVPWMVTSEFRRMSKACTKIR